MKHLNYGVYKTTESFRAIKQHACVCFDDTTLVAVTGRAEDQESQQYAQLFAAAPELLDALKMLVNICTHPQATKADMKRIANEARYTIEAAEKESE